MKKVERYEPICEEDRKAAELEIAYVERVMNALASDKKRSGRSARWSAGRCSPEVANAIPTVFRCKAMPDAPAI